MTSAGADRAEPAAASPRGGTPEPEPRRAVGPLSRQYRSLTVAMVALVGLAAFESLAVTVTMPTVVASLGGIGLYAMAFAAPFASSVVGLVAGGGWADRSGPRAPLYTGIGLFVLGLLVAGTASGMELLVAGRAVQGLGSGMLTVALYVAVARVYPDELQARVFAAFAAAWVLPSIVGPAIAGLISEQLGWRWVFLSVPGLVVPTVFLLWPALKDTPASGGTPAPPSSSAPFAPKRLLRAAGAGAALLALHLGGQGRGVAAATLVGGAFVLLAATVRGLLPPGTFRAARGLPAVVMVRGLLAAAFFGAEVYLPLLFTRERGLSPAQAGLALTAAALTWSTGSWLRGRQEGRRDDRMVLRVGSVAVVVGVGLGALAAWPTFPIAASLLGWSAAGFGMGLSYPTLSLLTLRLSLPQEQGLNSAALQVNEAVTTAAVLAVSGPVFVALADAGATSGAYVACFALSGSLALIAVVLSGRVAQRVVRAR